MKAAIYRGFDRADGVADMPQLWRFAVWVGNRLGQVITIDGVEHAQGNLLTVEPLTTEPGKWGSFAPVGKTAYRFERREGVVLVRDLRAYAEWLRPWLQIVMTGGDQKLIVRVGTDVALPLPAGDGVLLMRELLAFARAVGSRLQFTVQAKDESLISVSDVGGGLVANRRRVPLAVLVLETESRVRHGGVCGIRRSLVSPGNFVIKETTTDTYENGSVVSTVEASGVVQDWAPGETPDACADLVYDTNFDPEFEYGELQDSSLDEELLSFGSFFSGLISAMLATAAIQESGVFSWPAAEWAAASDVSTGFNAALGLVGVVLGATAYSQRWRGVNRGTEPVEVFWELRKSADASVVAGGSFVLGPREVGAWIGPVTTNPDPLEIVQYFITHISINGL